MMKRNPIPAVLLMLLPFTAQAQEVPGFASFSARHTEHKGIGYDSGYTSVDVFLAANPGRFVFFTDLKGHVFNDGKFAANTGLGMRVGVKGNTIGANGFFDLREYPRNSEERGSIYRVGGELEYLSSNCFEIRVNGYFPVGDSKHLHYPEFAY